MRRNPPPIIVSGDSSANASHVTNRAIIMEAIMVIKAQRITMKATATTSILLILKLPIDYAQRYGKGRAAYRT